MANFWSTNNVEPKRNFRFQVQLGGASAPILWWAKTVTIPAYDVSEVEHNYLDNRFYFPGRVTWNEVSMTLVDPISVDAVASTNQILVDMGYTVKADDTNKVTMSKKKAAAVANGPLPAVIISVLNADGAAIEVWTLRNAFLKSAKFGDLDYSSDDLRTVEMTIRYDWAECDTSGNTAIAAPPTGPLFEPQ
jgi:hypothetical protein